MQSQKILNSKSISLLLTLVSVLLLSFASAIYAAVEIASFEAQWNGSNNKITLNWETGSETDHSAFKVWRSTENLIITDGQIETDQATDMTEELAGQAVILNPSGSCTADGHVYEYIDETINQNETDYYYYLESLPCTGSDSTFYGDLNDEPNGLKVENPTVEFLIHLPIIMQTPAS